MRVRGLREHPLRGAQRGRLHHGACGKVLRRPQGGDRQEGRHHRRGPGRPHCGLLPPQGGPQRHRFRASAQGRRRHALRRAPLPSAQGRGGQGRGRHLRHGRGDQVRRHRGQGHHRGPDRRAVRRRVLRHRRLEAAHPGHRRRGAGPLRPELPHRSQHLPAEDHRPERAGMRRRQRGHGRGPHRQAPGGEERHPHLPGEAPRNARHQRGDRQSRGRGRGHPQCLGPGQRGHGRGRQGQGSGQHALPLRPGSQRPLQSPV